MSKLVSTEQAEISTEPTESELMQEKLLEEEYQATYKNDVRKLFAEGSFNILGYAVRNKQDEVFERVNSLNDEALVGFLDEVLERRVTIPLQEVSEVGAEEMPSALVVLMLIFADKLSILNKEVFTNKLVELASSELTREIVVENFFVASELQGTSEQINKFLDLLFNVFPIKLNGAGEKILEDTLNNNHEIFSKEESVGFLLNYAQSIYGDSYIKWFHPSEDDSDKFIAKILQRLQSGSLRNKLFENEKFLTDFLNLTNDGKKGINIFLKILSKNSFYLSNQKKFIEKIKDLVYGDEDQIKLFGELVLSYDLFSKDPSFLKALSYLGTRRDEEGNEVFHKVFAKILNRFAVIKDMPITEFIKNLASGTNKQTKLFAEIIKKNPDLLRQEEIIDTLKVISCYSSTFEYEKFEAFIEIAANSDAFLRQQDLVLALFAALSTTYGPKAALACSTITTILSKYSFADLDDLGNLTIVKNLVTVMAYIPRGGFELIKPQAIEFLKNHINLLETTPLPADSPLKDLAILSSWEPIVEKRSLDKEDNIITKLLKKVKTNLSGPTEKQILTQKLEKYLSLAVKGNKIAYKILESASEITDLSIDMFSQRKAGTNGEYSSFFKKIFVYDTQKLMNSEEDTVECINFVSTFIHESIHAVLDDSYKNSSKPFTDDDVLFKEEFSNIVEEIISKLKTSDILVTYNPEKYFCEIPAFFTQALVKQKLKQLLNVRAEDNNQDSVLLGNFNLNCWMANTASALDKAIVLCDEEPTTSVDCIGRAEIDAF